MDWVAAYDQGGPLAGEHGARPALLVLDLRRSAARPNGPRRLTPEAAAHELYARFNYAREMGFRVVVRRPGPHGLVLLLGQLEAGLPLRPLGEAGARRVAAGREQS